MQNKTFTRPTRQVLFWAKSLQCNSPLFNRDMGQVEVLAGQVNFRGTLPCSASNALEPMLHPVTAHVRILTRAGVKLPVSSGFHWVLRFALFFIIS